jgi:glucose-6-phosphate isomerase
VTFSYSQRLGLLADWYAQLLAESLGKRKSRKGVDVFVGPTPVRALGVTDQHSQMQLYAEGPFDKWFTLLAVEKQDYTVAIPPAFGDLEAISYLGGRTLNELFAAERDGVRVALTAARRPSVTFNFPKVGPHEIGQYIHCLEVAVACMGEHYDIDAFDQPGVEAGKIAAYALMGRAGFEQRRAEIESSAPKSRRTV